MRVIGIDFGTTCGYAWTDDGKVHPEFSGEWKLQNSKTDGAGMRFVRYQSKLEELIQTSPGFDDPKTKGWPVSVFFESAPPMAKARHTGSAAIQLFGAFLASTQTLCERLDVPYAGVTVQAVKKAATGKGNASKDAVVQAARDRWGAMITDEENNRADALWILQVGLDDLHPEGWAP